ncbi:MAG TPA: thiolase family protein [Streptosporangiaceae bacterium]|nr:thiolase family protein [Streptosporangiaceae bacterium]
MAARRHGVAIVGVGTVGFGTFTDSSSATLANAALERALEDSGLSRADVDGLLIQIGSPRGLDYDAAARLLALNVRFTSQTWSHGRFGATVMQHAALALTEGLADVVLCLAVFRNSAFAKIGTAGFPSFGEGLREGGGPHAETHWAGLAAPIGGAALAIQRYLHRYGIDREKLGRVAIAQRRAAAGNPLAVFSKEIDADEYARSPYVVEPLRVLDCSVMVDTAVAVILTTSERARDLRQRPVCLLAYQGIRGGPNEFVFGQPGLGVNQAEIFDYSPDKHVMSVFGKAGLDPGEIGTLHCYDGFAPQVLWTLERFGFCGPGEAADFIGDGRIELTGTLPVNTSGGHLSEGHSNGWGHTLEIVAQLRGQAGPRQIAGCETAMWGTTIGDAIIYGI